MSRATGLLLEEDAPLAHAAFIGVKLGASKPIGDHLGAIDALPDEAMALATAMGAFKDQDRSSTCVGHAITRGADTRLSFLGIPTRYGSPLAVVTLSNELLRPSKHDKLIDDGTYMRVAMHAAAEFGVPAESDWPLWKPDGSDVQNITEELPPHVLQRASAWKLTEQFTLYETGQARIDRCCDSLAKGFPLPVAAMVDELFEAHSSFDVIPAPVPGAGSGHALCIIGYRTSPIGKREFLISNSWRDWGFSLTPQIHGVAWVSEEWVLALREIYGFTLTHGVAS